MRSVFVAFVVAAGALLAAPSAAADDDCADGYLVRCQQDVSRGTVHSGASHPVGQVPRVQGVPCTGGHLGVCIALSQSKGESFPGLTTGPVLGPGAVIGNRP